MSFNINNILHRIPFFNRDRSGNITYTANSDSYKALGSNLDIAENHPILTPAILFVAKLYSQAKIGVYNKETNEEVKGHRVTELLKSPNMYQTQTDWLEEQMFIMIAQGKAVVYDRKKGIAGDTDSLYILNSDLLEYPEGFKTPMVSRSKSDEVFRQKLKYDQNGENLDIALEDLIFLYDLPNGMGKFMTESKSRLDGIKQVLQNTVDSQVAKNIVIKSNGKEMLSSDGGTFPMADDEKEVADRLFNTGLGLGASRKRGLITKASVKWQSMHIALRDLGLDESTKVDGNIIYTALHIAKDILSLEAKKTTYDNFKQSMSSYIQNELTPSLNAAMQSLNVLLGDEKGTLELRGSYDHMAVMQAVIKEKYTVSGVQAESLAKLLAVGIPEDEALEMCGFDKNTVLTPPKTQEDGQGQAEE